MKDLELQLVSELVRNCKRSDRELAKVLHVAQPTINRIRAKIDKQELVEYSASPNLPKLARARIVFKKRKKGTIF